MGGADQIGAPLVVCGGEKDGSRLNDGLYSFTLAGVMTS